MGYPQQCMMPQNAMMPTNAMMQQQAMMAIPQNSYRQHMGMPTPQQHMMPPPPQPQQQNMSLPTNPPQHQGGQQQGGGADFDMSKVQCSNCDMYGHSFSNCDQPFNKQKGADKEYIYVSYVPFVNGRSVAV